jgi:hypothetical protein
MKMNIFFAMTATIAVLCICSHSASASLLGMPLNLKAAIELHNVVASAPHVDFTDDVPTGHRWIGTLAICSPK